MTERPTPQQVDAALSAESPEFNPNDPIAVLAAEVRALRAELQAAEHSLHLVAAEREQLLAELSGGSVDDHAPEPELRTCTTHELYGCPLCDLEPEHKP